MDWGEITIDTDETFEEGPVRILDSRDQVLRRKTMQLVKVTGNTEEWRRQLGNTRTRCELPILSYLRVKVRCVIFGTRMTIAYACDLICICVGISRRNSLKGGRM